MGWIELALVAGWLSGWGGLTLFFAIVVGNVKNSPLSKTEDFPTFVFPLFFGWLWPVLAAMCLVVAPLTWLSDRATKRRTKPLATKGDQTRD